MVIITKKSTQPRKQQDFYPTPETLARVIVRDFVPFTARRLFDPGAGDGVFARALRSVRSTALKIDGCDIVDRNAAGWYTHYWTHDYLTLDLFDQYDCIFGNPPYSEAENFVRKSYDLLANNGKIVFLLKLAFLESKSRARGLFQELRPTEVHVLAGRPSFDGTGRTNDYAFAVFIWERPRSCAKPTPSLFFLDWN